MTTPKMEQRGSKVSAVTPNVTPTTSRKSRRQSSLFTPASVKKEEKQRQQNSQNNGGIEGNQVRENLTI